VKLYVSTLAFLLWQLSSSVLASSSSCGVAGTLEQRLKSCENLQSDELGLRIVSVFGENKVYTYDQKKDVIYSPFFSSNFKCPRPYTRYQKKNNQVRCQLKTASRYVLIENDLELMGRK